MIDVDIALAPLGGQARSWQMVTCCLRLDAGEPFPSASCFLSDVLFPDQTVCLAMTFITTATTVWGRLHPRPDDGQGNCIYPDVGNPSNEAR